MSKFTLLPKLIRVSRNCGFTNELNTILGEKLSDYEISVLERWLDIVQQEKEKHNSKNLFNHLR